MTTSYVPIVRNAAAGAIIYTALTPRTGPNGTFQTNPTLATGDVKISIDGAAFQNLGTLPAVTPSGGKAVKITLAQGETDGDNLVILFSDAAGAQWCDQVIPIQTASKGMVPFANATESVLNGTVTSGGSTTSIPTSALTILQAAVTGVVANQYKDRLIIFNADTTTAGLRGAVATISANTASNTPTLTVSTLPATPASGDLFSII